MTWLRDDPVLLVGMHRSGTTLVAKMLSELGLHLGRNLERNHESIAFLEANDRLLALSHSTWDRPEPWPWLVEHEQTLRSATDLASSLASRTRFRWRYAGMKGLVRRPVPAEWGFKDPRATLTLPVWSQLFPRARVVILRRHGVDVAASLRQRARQQLEDSTAPASDSHLMQFVSLHCLELDRAFGLWKFYNDFFDGPLRPHLACLDLRYEDLLQAPAEKLSEIADFIGLPAPAPRVAELCERVRPERALAHRSDAELVGFAARFSADDTLVRLGYESA